MDRLGRRIETAALLHDVGKVFLRAKLHKGSHTQCGYDFLQPFFRDGDQDILRAIKYHHAEELQGQDIFSDDISYLICEANRIAEGADDCLIEKDEKEFVCARGLQSIFNVFSGTGRNDCSFILQRLNEQERISYPVENASNCVSAKDYQNIVDLLKNHFQAVPPTEMESNELMRVLEEALSFIPADISKHSQSDISLCEHQRLTAALAMCMYQYFEAHGLKDYQSLCLGQECKTVRKTPMYLLVSGDMSGIQDFIYTIPSKGALKSLRGRSFYLELLLEHMADEILEECDLGRSCLLYTGGGHFYMLLPNTQATLDFLEAFSTRMNEWFLKKYGSRLYLAMAWTACSASEFMGIEHGAGAVFKRVSRKLSEAKLCRYDEKQLADMFDTGSALNQIKDNTKECSICHTSTQKLAPYGDTTMQGAEGEETMACQSCRDLFLLGKKVLDGDVFAVSAQNREDAMPLPGYREDLYLHALPWDTAVKAPFVIKKLYIKNKMYSRISHTTYLWMGDYAIRNQGRILEFQDLAMLSGGESDRTGIKRLGVLRADVDNLGAAFMAGFSEQYAIISRTTSLSRQLSLFFKKYINVLCRGQVNGFGQSGQTKFSLFGSDKNECRNVHIVYSGGDDMFLVGAWDDLIELAVDIRRAFAKFTNGKLTFSAGIGFFQDSCPISQMARKAGELEDYAKGNCDSSGHPIKNSIALFGSATEYQRPSKEGQAVLRNMARYTWDEFEQDVCGEKLAFLQSHFNYNQENGEGKLVIGKSGLYRLLQLVNEQSDGMHINLARFAYVLARLSPGKKSSAYSCYEEIREQLYEWYKQNQSRQQLATAIQLIIYNLREKKEV